MHRRALLSAVAAAAAGVLVGPGRATANQTGTADTLVAGVVARFQSILHKSRGMVGPRAFRAFNDVVGFAGRLAVNNTTVVYRVAPNLRDLILEVADAHGARIVRVQATAARTIHRLMARCVTLPAPAAI